MPALNAAHSVTRVEIPVDTRAPGGTTNAYIVDGLLVDPAARTDALDAAIGVGDVDSSDAETTHAIQAITVTHTHPDHVSAVDEYVDLTGATVFAHANHLDRFADATGIEPDRAFTDGDPIGDTGIIAADTPGHAADHVAFAVGSDSDGESGDSNGGSGDSNGGSGDSDAADARRELICGDLAVADGSVVVGAPDGDISDYLTSLERVRDAEYETLYPGHGPPIDNPESVCQRLIEHRLAREQSVLVAIEQGASDIDAILDAAYEKDLSGVEDLARVTVRAHVRKLVAEGKIGSAWSNRLARGRER